MKIQLKNPGIMLYKALILVTVTIVFGHAQSSPSYLESGRINMDYYSPGDYRGNVQNWSVVQDSNGFMYFGNTDGFVLQFDGVNWRKIKIDNESIVRSLFITESGIILVGGQDEFGYLKTDQVGRLVYKSLVSRIESANIQFTDVWKITVFKDKAYFISRNYLFSIPIDQLRDEQGVIKYIYSEQRLHTFYNDFENIYILKMGKGLHVLKGDSLKMIPGGEFYKNELFSGILPFNNSQKIIATRNRGLFLFDGRKSISFPTEADDWMKKNQLYNSQVLKDGNFLLLSRKGGALIINRKGKVLNKFDKSNGLVSNLIWSAYQDNAGSIWLCLNKGIVRIDYSSPFNFYSELNGLEGSVHDVKRFNKQLYVSTGTGLYFLERKQTALKNTSFKHFEEINTQCWYLTVTDDFLLVCSNNGIYEVSRENKLKLVGKYNAWTIVQSVSDPNRFFVGLDVGVLSIYRNEDGEWVDEKTGPMANIEGRSIVEDNQKNIWIGSSFQGIAKISNFEQYQKAGERLNVQYFTTVDGLASNRLNLVKPYKSGVRFNTTGGIMIFDESKQRFSGDPRYPIFNNLKATENSHVLSYEDNNGNVWCNLGSKIVINNSNDKNIFISEPFLNISELNIQTIFVEKNNICWFGGADGIVRFNGYLDVNTAEMKNTVVRSVFINNDSLVFGGNGIAEFTKPEFESNMNNIRFEFAAPIFNLAEKPLYQYYLDGFDQEWSNAKNETAKEYTNLGPGEYSFVVRAQTILGLVKSSKFKFSILSPWYQSWWFLTVLIVLLVGVVLVAIRYLIKTTHDKAVIEQRKIAQDQMAFEESLRNQMAADFHDELGNKITRISLFSELIKQEEINLPENILKYVEKISENTNSLYSETRDFIWQLDPKKDTLFDFITRIKKFADDLFDETTIHFEMTNNIKNADHLKLTMEWRRHLIRIFKEALHNSFKYSQCKNINFKLSSEDNKLIIELLDDGVGFDMKINSEGNGLRNMLNRSQKVGARLNINSAPGKGTQIKMVVNKPELV